MKKKELIEDSIESINENIRIKLWRAKQEIGKVTKGNDNPYFKSKYADLNTLLEACEPILLKYGMIILQPLKDGKVCTTIMDINSGDEVKSELELPQIADPQKLIACCTYYRRITLQSLLTLQAIDDDGNMASQAIRTQKKTLTDERFNEAIKACLNGTYDPNKLIQLYELTESQMERFNEVIS